MAEVDGITWDDLDGCESSKYKSDKFWGKAGFDVTGIGDVLACFLPLLMWEEIATLNLLRLFTLEDVVASFCSSSVTDSSLSEARV